MFLTGLKLNTDEVRLIHHFVEFRDSDPKYEVDLDVARRLAEALDQDTPQFVLVNKRGVHFPYHRSYPEAQAVFRPTIDPGKKLTDKPFAVNFVVGIAGLDRKFSDCCVSVGVEEKVPVAIVSQGSPLVYTPTLREAGMKVIHVCSTVRHV
jgi:NAD(P)H-dependent flavin oxidoreductase YrpB (nitropropane dioxygenase family)